MSGLCRRAEGWNVPVRSPLLLPSTVVNAEGMLLVGSSGSEQAAGI